MGAQPYERGIPISRRAVLGRTAALAAPLLAACSQDAYSPSHASSSPVSKPGGAAAITSVNSEDAIEGKIKATAEAANSPEQQARMAAFNFFLGKLSKPENFDIPSNLSIFHRHRIEPTISTPLAEATKTAIANGKPVSSDTLSVKWAYKSSLRGTTVGEAQLQTFTISPKPQTLTPADRANNIQWKGIVGIGFLEHHRVEFLVERGVNPNTGIAVDQLITDPNIDLKTLRYPDPSQLKYTDWKDTLFPVSVTNRNNQWVAEPAVVPTDDIVFPIPDYNFSTNKPSTCLTDSCKEVYATRITPPAAQPAK